MAILNRACATPQLSKFPCPCVCLTIQNSATLKCLQIFQVLFFLRRARLGLVAIAWLNGSMLLRSWKSMSVEILFVEIWVRKRSCWLKVGDWGHGPSRLRNSIQMHDCIQLEQLVSRLSKLFIFFWCLALDWKCKQKQDSIVFTIIINDRNKQHNLFLHIGFWIRVLLW